MAFKKVLHPDGKRVPSSFRKAQFTHQRPGVESFAFDPGTSLPVVSFRGSGRLVADTLCAIEAPQVMVNQAVIPQSTPVFFNAPVTNGLSNPQNTANIDDPSTYASAVAAIELE